LLQAGPGTETLPAHIPLMRPEPVAIAE
jgi:hypothetical protein